jgi:hypothetical protein
MKQAAREEQALVQLPDGSFWAVPLGWTDRAEPDPYLAVGKGRSRFRVPDLLALVDLLETIEKRGR